MLLAAAKIELESRGFQVETFKQRSGVEQKDGLVFLDDTQAHLEVENSSLSKPVKVLKNYRRAVENGCECIFVVEDGKEEKLKRIVEDPVNRQGDDDEDEKSSYSYYQGEDGEFTDTELLKEEGEYQVLSFSEDELAEYGGDDEGRNECPMLDERPEEELENTCLHRDPDTGHCMILDKPCVLIETDD